YIAVALSAICLLLGIVLIWSAQSGQSAQLEFQKRQNTMQIDIQQRQGEVQRGVVSNQVGTQILQDLASVALKNSKVKDVLAKHGFNVSAAPATGASTSPTP